MDRRTFLRWTGASGLAVGLGRLAAGRPGATLRSAFERAASVGRPLLVLVIPRDAGPARFRAAQLGDLLRDGPERAYAALATVDLVCASYRTVERELDALPVDVDPAYVRVERTKDGDVVAPFAFEPMSTVDALAAPLIDRLLDRSTLRRLGRAVRLDRQDRDRIDDMVAAGDVPRSARLDRSLERGAAYAMMRCLEDERAPLRRAIEGRVAALVQARLETTAPGGAEWREATAPVCGLPKSQGGPTPPCGAAFLPRGESAVPLPVHSATLTPERKSLEPDARVAVR